MFSYFPLLVLPLSYAIFSPQYLFHRFIKDFLNLVTITILLLPASTPTARFFSHAPAAETRNYILSTIFSNKRCEYTLTISDKLRYYGCVILVNVFLHKMTRNANSMVQLTLTRQRTKKQNRSRITQLDKEYQDLGSVVIDSTVFGTGITGKRWEHLEKICRGLTLPLPLT